MWSVLCRISVLVLLMLLLQHSTVMMGASTLNRSCRWLTVTLQEAGSFWICKPSYIKIFSFFIQNYKMLICTCMSLFHIISREMNMWPLTDIWFQNKIVALCAEECGQESHPPDPPKKNKKLNKYFFIKQNNWRWHQFPPLLLKLCPDILTTFFLFFFPPPNRSSSKSSLSLRQQQYKALSRSISVIHRLQGSSIIHAWRCWTDWIVTTLVGRGAEN